MASSLQGPLHKGIGDEKKFRSKLLKSAQLFGKKWF